MQKIKHWWLVMMVMEKVVQMIVLAKKGVFVEARASNGGVEFDALPLLPGFPRRLEFQQEISIPVSNFTEIFYVREQVRKDALGKEETVWSLPWFIKVSPDDMVTKAYIPEEMK